MGDEQPDTHSIAAALQPGKDGLLIAGGRFQAEPLLLVPRLSDCPSANILLEEKGKWEYLSNGSVIVPIADEALSLIVHTWGHLQG